MRWSASTTSKPARPTELPDRPGDPILPDRFVDDHAGQVVRVRGLLLNRHAGPPSDDPVQRLLDLPGVLSVDVVDHDRLELLGQRSMDTAPPHWGGLAWLVAGAAVPHGLLGPSDVLASWTADRRLVWDDHPGVDDPTRAVKMVSFVRRLDGLDDATFVERYLAHASVACRHHGMHRYRQNVVATGSPVGAAPDAISELSFASEDAWRDDFYLASDSMAAVAADVAGFLDRRTTASTLVTEHLRTG